MKYIIFIDGTMRGYLDDLNSAKDNILFITEKLIKERKEENANKQIRIFTEQTETGINIFLQEIGKYINGSVCLVNTIEYKPIKKIELNNLE